MKDIIKRIRQKEKPEYDTLTVKLPKKLLDKFRARCAKEKVYQVEVVRQFMGLWLGE